VLCDTQAPNINAVSGTIRDTAARFMIMALSRNVLPDKESPRAFKGLTAGFAGGYAEITDFTG
jgi:hypothetical protein